ncbi:uncharacterized protein IL334_005646 [Kwoniella shivajii]|uniref:F-box domain-containing protein n=1 Tax=Kwoniella shivajii TaxID=564305 RepID=A0ABZ1D7P3_9TREE|nr:hypothetical protein IL334_005646 [Kwoniella shivajii]
MPFTPENEILSNNTIESVDQVNLEGLQVHDELDLLSTTPNRLSLPRKNPHPKSKKLSLNSSLTGSGSGSGSSSSSKWKGKGKNRDLSLREEGECPLLNLPEDIIHILLSRIPPRDLTKLALTCKDLYEELEDESIWRQSYINRFVSDGAARSRQAKQDVEVLVQSCLNNGGRGWRREALSREAMLDRWTGSKASMVMHTPPAGLIDSLSLSYPPFVPAAPKSLVVGKNHQTPIKGKSSPAPLAAAPSTPTPVNCESSLSVLPHDEAPPSTPAKLTHRQKYEAILAATTRPPPYVLSASLIQGGVVRSDPLSGKVSKGFWGPGRDANFHLRPHLDPSAEPSSLYIPTRSQSFVIWGLRTGSCVHTTMQSRHHATHGGRASSVNVHSDLPDSHNGDITDIWAPDQSIAENLRWVTGGEDGKVKLWQLHPGSGTRSGKRTPNDVIPASIVCLFSSEVVDQPLNNRSEASKRRQNGRPDFIIIARYDSTSDVVCGVTVDGDLRVWFSASIGPIEVGVDVGSEELEGGVKTMSLDVGKDEQGLVASLLIHHQHSATFARYDIRPDGDVQITTYVIPTGSSISAIHTSFKSTPPISASSIGTPPSTHILTPGETPESISPAGEQHDSLSSASLTNSRYGRFVMAGDETGYIHIWSWDSEDGQPKQIPIRSWEATHGRVTALDFSCGLVAVGSYDGYIKIFDPLPYHSDLLRTFHASRLTPGELLVAASEEPDGRYYTVNKVILENDLVVASLGRKVFAWRAGTGKGRQGGKESGWRRTSGGRTDGKGSSRGLDMKAIHRAAVADNSDLEESPSSKHEVREQRVLDEMGLDGDDALQYALMLSMDDSSIPSSHVQEGSINDVEENDTSITTPSVGPEEEDEDDGLDQETREAIRQVEAFKKQEEEELNKVLEMIRLSEESEHNKP